MDDTSSSFGVTGGQGGLPSTSETAGTGSNPGNIPIVTTQPDRIIRHNISDEQLEMLGRTKRDGLFETMWACIGVAGGAVMPAIRHIHDAYSVSPPKQIEFLDLCEILLCVVPLALAIALGTIYFMRSRSAIDLVETIRKQRTTIDQLK